MKISNLYAYVIHVIYYFYPTFDRTTFTNFSNTLYQMPKERQSYKNPAARNAAAQIIIILIHILPLCI